MYLLFVNWVQHGGSGRLKPSRATAVLHGSSTRRLKRKGKGVLGAREARGPDPGAKAGEEGGKEMPARRLLFSPSPLLIMYAKITQLWMTSCQISLAAKHLFLASVFLKQENWSEGEWRYVLQQKKFKCGRPLKEESCNDEWLVI